MRVRHDGRRVREAKTLEVTRTQSRVRSPTSCWAAGPDPAFKHIFNRSTRLTPLAPVKLKARA